MTTRLAAVRRGDKRAYRALLEEHGAALEHLARALGQEARLSTTLIRVWRDAAYISATSDERAFVLSVGVRELARAMLPVELRLLPDHDPASMAFYLARGMTGIGDAT
ncbi:hypothetical protein L6R52_20815, partial [Myxococcota bacterium]|nr:hypothetical protein [Myxococcota bacterium]